MTTHENEITIREAVGVFSGGETLDAAIVELLAAGFHRQELGLLAGEQVIEQSLGGYYARTNANPDTPESPAIAFVNRDAIDETAKSVGGGLFFIGSTGVMGALVASSAILGGPMLAAIVGAVAVGVAGAVAVTVSNQSDAEGLREQVDKGHILLFVRIADASREKEVMDILKKHSGMDVRMYDAPIERCIPLLPQSFNADMSLRS